jgi:hypothetical protein
VSGKPSGQALRASLQVLAEELMRTHPEWEVRIHDPDEPPPPGAVTLPVLAEDDVEAVRRGKPRRRR